jgi:hypothetical protein
MPELTIEIDDDELAFLIRAAECRHGKSWADAKHARQIARTLLTGAINAHRDDPAYCVPHAPGELVEEPKR